MRHSASLAGRLDIIHAAGVQRSREVTHTTKAANWGDQQTRQCVTGIASCDLGALQIREPDCGVPLLPQAGCEAGKWVTRREQSRVTSRECRSHS